MKILLGFLLLLAGVFLLPLPESGQLFDGLDPGKVRLGLGFFVCIAFLWMTEAFPLPVTALLAPVLAALLGLSDFKEALAAFAHPLIFLFLGGFALAKALSVQGLDRWLAEKIGHLGKGKFLPVAIWLFIGTAALSMWISNTATTAMMLPLALGVLNQANSEGSRTSNTYFLLLGLAYAASIGGLGTIAGSPPNGIAAKQLDITFAQWMGFGIPAVLVLLPSMIVVLWMLFRPSNHDIQLHEKKESFKFSRKRLITLGIFALTAVAWIFSEELSKLLTIGNMGSWIAIVAIIALIASHSLSWKELEEGTEWGVLLLFGGGLALSMILSQSGTSLFLARVLGGVIDNWPLWALVAAVVAFVIFLTELSSNTASAAILVPIFYSMAKATELPANQLVLPLALAASCAFMLPVATAPNAIVFGSGEIAQPTMMRTGIVLNLLFIVLITALSLVLF
ncbi:MAG: DASS family sodium-coupled anion symporter [Akkermansiaceae bacterium]